MFQGGFSNYGIDWEGPVPEMSPDVVEVPVTNCPFSEIQVNALPTVTSLSYVDAVQTFADIINLLPNN